MLRGVNRVVMADYFSRYPEVIKLRPTTSSGVIDAVKAVLSRHGIPETVHCDNGTQFSSIIHLDNASSLLNTPDLLSELPHIGVTVPHLADRFLLHTSMIVIHSASSSNIMCLSDEHWCSRQCLPCTRIYQIHVES